MPIDAVLFDLDGVVYHGPHPIPGAVEGITFLNDAGVGVNFVTNNAARTPETVAEHISSFGIPTRVEDITTAALVLAANLAEAHPTGSRIYLVGTTGLRIALEDAGLIPTDTLADEPVAIAQGLDPDITYDSIARLCHAVRTGIDWWASNPDYSMPGPDGPVPGNGAFIDMVARITGGQPRIVGKPAPEMMRHAAARLGATRPLMVGDRLDTDIEGGNAAGFDTALVLTGTHDIHDALRAPAGVRPTHILPDLRGLRALLADPGPAPTQQTSAAATATASARIIDGEIHLDEGRLDDPRAVIAALRLAWEATDRGLSIAPGNLPRRIDD